TDAPTGRWVARVHVFKLMKAIVPQRFSLIGPWGPDDQPPVVTANAEINLKSTDKDFFDAAGFDFAAACRVSTRDFRDPNPRVVVDAPCCLPIGSTEVTFTAIDAAANRSSVKTTVRVGR